MDFGGDLIINLSFSQLNKYTDCGERFRLEKIVGHRGKPAAWTIKGSALHMALQNWELSDRGWTADDIRDGWDMAWKEHLGVTLLEFPLMAAWAKTPRIQSVQKDLDARYKDGLVEVQDYVEMASSAGWQVGRAGEEPLIERSFDLEYPVMDINIRGVIDLVKFWPSTGEYTICDLKTGNSDREEPRQLALYAWALEKQHDIKASYGEYWYTKLRRSSGWINLTEYGEDFILGEYMDLRRGAYDEKIFLASPGKKKCQMCPVREHCLLMRDKSV